MTTFNALTILKSRKVSDERIKWTFIYCKYVAKSK